jgi:hypothetical protein
MLLLAMMSLQLILISPVFGSSFEKKSITVEDAAVYRAVLDFTYNNRRDTRRLPFETIDGVIRNIKERFLIVDKTVSNENLDSSFHSFMNNAKSSFINSDLRDSFKKRNAISVDMTEFINTEAEEIKLIRYEEIKKIFRKGAWDEFYKHTRSRGWGRFSLPAYSRDTSEALVLFSFSCGGVCGRESLYLLRKENDRWAIIKEYIIVIS